jgi:hypothetical protein
MKLGADRNDRPRNDPSRCPYAQPAPPTAPLKPEATTAGSGGCGAHQTRDTNASPRCSATSRRRMAYVLLVADKQVGCPGKRGTRFAGHTQL